jgi:hypothetical protein
MVFATKEKGEKEGRLVAKTLTEAMSAGPTTKKRYVIFAVSFLENYVLCSLLPVIRTTFVPAPEY